MKLRFLLFVPIMACRPAVAIAPMTPAAAAAPHAKAEPAWNSVDACLEAPRCSATELARLMQDTEDDDCFRFLDDAGMPRDDARGRSCLERTVKANDARSASSCDLAQAELATMRIDGRGGPVDIAAARSLFANCYEDITKSGILEHAAKKEKNAATPAVDFCRDIGGTTLTSTFCLARSAHAERMRTAVVEKDLAKTLDDAALPLLVTARKAMLAFAAADSDLVYQQYIEGSVRGAMSMVRSQTVIHDWQLELGRLADTKRPKTPDIVLEQKLLQMRLEPEEYEAVKVSLTSSQDAWTAYRDAHLALVEVTHGRDARDAAEARLTATRIGHLQGDDTH